MEKRTLAEVITEMLKMEDLSAQQMQIIDLLCQINESEEIAASTEYDYEGEQLDKFKDFVVENEDKIWSAFNAAKIPGLSGNIDKIVLLNAKERKDDTEESRILINVKYVNGIPKFYYVRIVYNITENSGNVRKTIYNWNVNKDTCEYNFEEVANEDKKSDFFIKIMLN